jgi:hypothetical protein
MPLRSTLCGVFALLVTYAGALADPCDSTFPQTSGLWALVAAGANYPTDTWIPVTSSTPLSANTLIRFAFVGRQTTVVPNKEGAISIKLMRMPQPEEQPATYIVLRRNVGPTCGIYSSWGVQLISSQLDFIVGQSVDVTDYIIYHAADSTNNSTIQRFHVEYNSENDDCVGTDSPKGNRRTAFLAEYNGAPIKASAAVVAALVQQAQAGEGKPLPSLPLAKIIGSELKAFRGFAAIETQIQTYPLNGRVCVTFSDQSRQQETVSRIEIVDLDDPKNSTVPRRKRWIIHWK